jgi:hypothetical protein
VRAPTKLTDSTKLKDKIQVAIQNALAVTERETTRQLRKQALDVGWPPTAAQTLSVNLKDGHASVSFEGAEEWEYGTETRPPMPVARSFQQHLDTQADPIFSAALAQQLGGLL